MTQTQQKLTARQTDRQTDRPLGRQGRQTSEVGEGDVFGEDVVLISARVAECLPYMMTTHQGHHM